jgi:hypothetical protein
VVRWAICIGREISAERSYIDIPGVVFLVGSPLNLARTPSVEEEEIRKGGASTIQTVDITHCHVFRKQEISYKRRRRDLFASWQGAVRIWASAHHESQEEATRCNA